MFSVPQICVNQITACPYWMKNNLNSTFLLVAVLRVLQFSANDTGTRTLQRKKNDRRHRHDDRQTGPHLDEVLRLVATRSHNHQIALMGKREDEGAAGPVGHGKKGHADIDAAGFRCCKCNRREDHRCGGVVRGGAEQCRDGKQHTEHVELPHAKPGRKQGRREFSSHTGLEECVTKWNRPNDQKEDAPIDCFLSTSKRDAAGSHH